MKFQKNEFIGKYKVQFPIKSSNYAETYRVSQPTGGLAFLKLIGHDKLIDSQTDAHGHIKEVSILKALHQHNICRFIDSDTIDINGVLHTFYLTEFISNETIEARRKRVLFNTEDIKSIAKSVLSALDAMHSNTLPMLHNDVTSENVLYDLTGRPTDVKLIDFGNACYAGDNLPPADTESTDPFYMAPERLLGQCTVESDLYSVGVLIYHLLFSRHPWDLSLEGIPSEQRVFVINETRKKPLLLPAMNINGLDEQLTNIIVKALQYQPEDRFHSATEFIEALDNKNIVSRQQTEIKRGSILNKKDNAAKTVVKEGNGFKDVAGFSELKQQLQSDVIDLLEAPEQAKELGLHLPNGLLFYGPPGCGKTFFAEKFAEEMKCNYMYVKCSDVASPYIHGGQEKIAAIFQSARENAPTVVFLDEIDALLKNRDKQNNVSESGEVNEFLEQLNNCGKDNVIVIGATNKPYEIDEAALRAGRLELKYFIPLPDKETREELFKIELNKRSSDQSIDFTKLAELTDNYSCADIKLIVDNAARIVFRKKQKLITQDDLLQAIQTTKPSLSQATIREHQKIKEEFERTGEKKFTRIGFQFP